MRLEEIGSCAHEQSIEVEILALFRLLCIVSVFALLGDGYRPVCLVVSPLHAGAEFRHAADWLSGGSGWLEGKTPLVFGAILCCVFCPFSSAPNTCVNNHKMQHTPKFVCRPQERQWAVERPASASTLPRGLSA